MNCRKITLLATLTLLAGAAIHLQSREADFVPTSPVAEPRPAAREDLLPIVNTRVASSAETADLGPGARLGYQTRWTTTHRIQAIRQANAQEIHIEANGALEFVVLAARGDELAIGFRMPDAATVLRVGNEDADASLLTKDLGTGAIARVTRDGTLLGFRFPPTVDPRQRNLLRRLFATLRIPGWTGATTWTCSDGVFGGDPVTVAARRIDAGDAPPVIQWTRQSQRDPGGTKVAPEFAIHGRGDGTLAWDAGASWWGVIDHTEEARCEHAAAGIRVDSKLTATHHLTGASRQPAAPDFDWDGAWESTTGEDDVAAAAALGERQQWAHTLRGATVTGELDHLAEILARGEQADGEIPPRIERLRWLLRLQPDALGILTTRLQDAEVNPTLAAILCTAMAGEGSDRAQVVLTDLAKNADSPLRRGAALAAMFHLTAANSTTLAAVEHVLEHETEGELHNMALLLTGALARPECHTDADLLPRLLAQEHFAATTDRLDAWLEALGNSGREEVLGVGERYLRHANPALRVAAVAALRRIAADAAVELLVTAAGDTDPVVRLRSLEAMTGRNSSRAASAMLKATSDAEESVRIAAIHGLAERQDADLYRDRLLRIGRDDTSPRVREIANAAVGQLLARGR